MKALALAAALLSLLAPRALAQSGGSVGAGIMVGDPTGLTGKYWIDEVMALDVGVGFSGDAAIYADALWHARNLLPVKRGSFSGYAGLGPRIETDNDTEFGLRTVAGLAYWVQEHPIELFVEAGPVFRLEPSRQVNLDAAAGVRFYFGR